MMKRFLFIIISIILITNIVYGNLYNFEKNKFVSDEVIIKLKENKNIDSLNLDKNKVKRIIQTKDEQFKKNGLDRLYLLKVKDVNKAIRNLKNHPSIEYVEPNYIVHTTLTPNDPDFSKLYGLHNTGQTGGTSDADIDAPEAWDIQTGSDTIVVAVIDTGVDYNHEDLAANMWVNVNEIPNNNIDDDNNGFIDDYLGWDFVNNDNDPFDDFGHGTHCSGTIGAVGNNSIGVVGVNWDVKIMPIKFLSSSGSGTLADAISSIEYAIMMKVDIMSNSWGGGGFSQSLKDAIESANEAGILFIAAAGNSGANSDLFPMYPAAYDNDNIVSVAATDHNNNLAWFSNYGKISVDLGAPGVSTFSTVPTGFCSLCDASGYRFLSGTSMATPHVAGAAALIKAQFPGITHLEIKSRLLSSVDHLTSLEGKTVSEGRLNAFNSFDEDSTAPGNIKDLTTMDKRFSSITLTWTATGDDNNTGTASSYDLRYSTSLINNTNFDNANKASNLPKPQVSGSTEIFTVTGLLSSTTYYFAIKAIDNVGNKGVISNIVSETTTEPTVLFYDDFESGINGWTTTGDTSLWHQETAQSDRTEQSNMTSWTYNTGSPNYNYDIGTNFGTLTSPQIDLTNINNTMLTFYGFYETETTGTTWDQRWVQISVNNGSFTNLVQLSGEAMNIWHKHEIDISEYAGNTIQIRFFFNTRDSLFNNFWGWSIDDFTILVDSGDTPPPIINNPPIADANGPYTGIEDIIVIFDGSGSFDPDNDTLTYNWDFGDGTTGTGINPNHTYTAGGIYNVILIVNDGQVDSTPNTTTANIIEVNDPPIANAGPDQTLIDSDGNGFETVILNGSNSFDSDGTIISYEWFENSVLIASGINSIVSFSVGEHNITLTVTDNGGTNIGGLTDSDEVLINISSIEIDNVTITKAQYRIKNGMFVIEATTNDLNATLIVVEYGEMKKIGGEGKHVLRQKKISNPNLSTITVKSSSGGSDTVILEYI